MPHRFLIAIRVGVRRLLARPVAGSLFNREDGAVAVEFGLVAAPFLAVLFAILETSLIFFASQTLENVAANAARLVLTGQASGLSQADFMKLLCPMPPPPAPQVPSKAGGLFDCSKIMVDVRTAASFATITAPTAQDIQNNNFTFDTGAPGSVVVVRLMYQWPTYVSFQGVQWLGLGSPHLMTATAAFRNEQFPAPPPGP